MYGGRVIDDFDRRVVKTYMDEYMGDFIFDTFQPFHFYMGEEVDYFIPKPEKGRYQSHFIFYLVPLLLNCPLFGIIPSVQDPDRFCQFGNSSVSLLPF